MTNNQTTIAAKTQDDIIASLNAKPNIDWLSIRMHQDNLAATLDEKSGNHGTMTLSGASTHQFQTAGWFTGTDGSPAGTVYYRDELNVSSLESVCRLDDIETSGGSMLVVFDIWLSTRAATAVENLFSFGQIGAGVKGYWQIFNDTTGNIKMNVVSVDLSGGKTNTLAVGKFTDSTRHTVGFLVDADDLTLKSYLDNASSHDNAVDITGLASGWAAPSGDKGLTIAGKGVSASVDNIFGETADRECRISDILIVKDTSTALAANARAIVSRMYNERGDLPKELRDL